MASEHAINGEIGAHVRWAKTTKADRARATAPARAGLLARFAREADPDGRMSDEDRLAAAEHLLKAHMKRCAQKSAAARRKNRTSDAA